LHDAEIWKIQKMYYWMDDTNYDSNGRNYGVY